MGVVNNIVLDCDPGEDDALAILLALAKKLDVVALVCGFGNTSADKTIRNGAGLLTLANRVDVPLFKGAEKPYRTHPLEQKIVSAGSFVGENGLCGVNLAISPDIADTGIENTQEQRINFFVEHLQKVGPVTYIVTGPCATLAHILDILGTHASKIIHQIIVMGGALDAHGNEGPINPETGKPFAEFNFYCDPYAVDRVLRSGIPVTLVPWDLTEKIVMTYTELSSWQGNSEQGQFVVELMRNFLEQYGNAHERSFEFNDCVTITALEGRGKFREEKVRVILEGQETGRLVRDQTHGVVCHLFDIEPAGILAIRNEILEVLTVRKAASALNS